MTFDPYMFLSVPLPSVSDKILEVTLLFSGASKPTTTFGVKVPQQGSVYNLKVALSRQANVPLQRLIIGEIWKGKIYKIFPNNHLLGDIRPGDKVWAWECPEMENFPPQKETEITTYEISQAVLCICKESNSYWLGSSSRVVSETFGVPFPLIFPSGQEVRAIDLHQQIDGLLSRFVKAPVSEGCDENDCSGPIEEPPYVIRPLDLGVQQAKDIIPKDDSFLDARMTSFAVDWQDVDRYDPSCIENIILDDSAPSKNPGSFGSTQQPSIHLSDCINCYTESEQLNEDNAWYCSSCKEFRCATKKFDLWSVPEVLIIHLKRFQYSRMYRDKIDSFVDFPLESLDMKEWVIGTQGLDSRPLKYDLYGISNHMGGLGGGHYTAFIKSIVDGQWYDISDSSVSPVSVENIKTSSAYVLFYTRQE